MNISRSFKTFILVGALLGSGKQWIPWIHWHDVINMYIQAVENNLFNGTYNMVAPHPISNKLFIKAVAKQLGRQLFFPNVPALLLKLVLGEMSLVVLGSTRVDSKKIQDIGYNFGFSNIEAALQEIYGK